MTSVSMVFSPLDGMVWLREVVSPVYGSSTNEPPGMRTGLSAQAVRMMAATAADAGMTMRVAFMTGGTSGNVI